MNPVQPGQLTLKGEFHERLLRSIRHLQELNTEEMRREFTHPDDFWHWGADYMGRWISAMALLGQYTGVDYGVQAVVHELIDFQREDGSFGPYTDPHDFQEWFGMSRGLVGLLEYHLVNPDPDVLEAAARLGNYYIQHYPDCAPCLYECYSTALEGLVLLSRITGQSKYTAFARQVAESSVVYKGLRYSHEVDPNGRRTPAAGQVHCQLTTARGLLDLFEFTGENHYLEPVLDLHDYISNELMWITGGIGFYYFRPEENETCADADWLRLNLQLWRLTGHARYMELAERILLNQIYFNQTDNGGFCYLRGLQNRAGAVFDACCSHHGPRAFYETLRYIYTTSQQTVWINLYMEGEARLALDQGRLRFTSTITNETGQVNVHLLFQEVPSEQVKLKVRIPEWASQTALAINGIPLTLVPEDGYAQIENMWSPGDRLEIRFSLSVRVVQGETLGQHVLVPEEAAVFYGPRLFCLNDKLNPAVRLHLARLKLPAKPPDGFTVKGPDHLEAEGITPEDAHERLVFSPLAETGGIPSGSGRIHTVRAPYFKVWIPIERLPTLG
jgi:DUF1680 family protein